MPLSTLRCAALMSVTVLSVTLSCAGTALAQTENNSRAASHQNTPSAAKPSAHEKQSTEDQELQQAINEAGNDRAAVVRNLEEFLKKHPDAQQRPQIYRALVEATLQLRDNVRAADYAERIVALNPEDISITLLAIQLLERNSDEAGLRRAMSYSTRVLQYVEQTSAAEKSPQVSQQEWEKEKARDKTSVLLLRGRLYLKLHESTAAQKDFEASYAVLPSAAAAEKLGEIAELTSDPALAIRHYARAFALADAATGSAGRREIRQKLGNVWRLAHGSDDGLGDYLLHTYDDLAAPGAQAKRNAGAKEPYEFTLRKAPDGVPFPLAAMGGKFVVVNFWATWCGPCHTLEPLFDHVAAAFRGTPDLVFLSANCDEDETLVPGYLQEEKPRTTVVYADGLDRLLAINSFPTMIILDRAGRIAYRAEGFDPDSVEQDLTDAVKHVIAIGDSAAAGTEKKSR
jgi:thiol-disulfide isomerase/thioredoxin